MLVTCCAQCHFTVVCKKGASVIQHRAVEWSLVRSVGDGLAAVSRVMNDETLANVGSV